MFCGGEVQDYYLRSRTTRSFRVSENLVIVIRGVNVFPSQIESVLLEMGDVEPHYQLIVDGVNNLDVLEVLVEVSERIFSDEVKRLEQLENKLTRAIEGCAWNISLTTLLLLGLLPHQSLLAVSISE